MILSIQKQILALKKQKDILILAHSYQSPEILEIADAVGDSFALSKYATKYPQKTIILCGVRFMAETVKILSPEKTVILPVANATCPMAEQITPQEIIEFKKKNPIFKVVCYINTTAELKRVCDVCVTSSSALKIVSKIKEPILFVPDKNLGSYIKSQIPGKDIILMSGCCPVHDAVDEDDIKTAKAMYPDYKIAVHPEVRPEIAKQADFVGSTSAIVDYAASVNDNILVGTEKSISDYLNMKFPKRRFPLLSKKLICPDMRLTTLMDVYRAVAGIGGEVIELDNETIAQARVPIDAMMKLAE